MPSTLKPQLQEIVNQTEYLIVTLSWGVEVDYGDQLSLVPASSSRRILAESVDLIGELFTFEMYSESTMPLPDVSLLDFTSEIVRLNVSKAGGGNFTESEIED